MKKEKKTKFKVIKGDDEPNKLIYHCPDCGDPIYSGDVLIVINGSYYCLECERPPSWQCKTISVFCVLKIPPINRKGRK